MSELIQPGKDTYILPLFLYVVSLFVFSVQKQRKKLIYMEHIWHVTLLSYFTVRFFDKI